MNKFSFVQVLTYCNVSTLYVYIKEWDVYKDVEEYRNAGFPRDWHKYNKPKP